MTRRPSFQFYPADFLGGTNHMTRAATGAYVAMLCNSWEAGPIPDTKMALHKSMSLGPDDPPFKDLWGEIRPKWTLVDGAWVNPRLEQVREDRARYIEAQRAKGQQGGRPRKTMGFTQHEPAGLPEVKPDETRGFTQHGPAGLPEVKPNETSSISDLRSSSSTPDQEQRQGAPDPHWVLVKLAHSVLDEVDAGRLHLPDAKDELKSRSAKARIDYDARSITKALDSAERQRTSPRRYA